MTIYDIAHELRLSPATVSMALNDDRRVAEKTRCRVRRFAEENGFKRNEQARNFRLKRTNTVAVVVYNIDNDFWSGVVKAVEDEMGENYNVILCNTDEDLAKEKKIIRNLRQRQVDGVIIQPVSREDAHLVELNRAGIPVVLFEKTENEELSFVKGNDRQAACNVFRECVAAGHRKIAFLSFQTEVIGVHDRIRGFRQGCLEAGLENECDIFVAPELSADAVATVFIPQAREFSLVICCDDRLACLLLKTLSEAGIAVPADLSVIGWNNSKFLDYMNPPLTSVCIPVKAMGRSAAEIILGYLAGHHDPVKQYVGEEMIYRASFKKLNP